MPRFGYRSVIKSKMKMNKIPNLIKYVGIALATSTLCFANLNAKDTSMKTSLSNKEKVAHLISSIETGDADPIGYINPNKYIQHNLAVADGLAGFGAVLQALPEGSAKANVVRIFQDGDYVFAHTEYNFFGPKVGFDIFRFEDGLIVEHWDNLQEIAQSSISGRSQIDGTVELVDLDKTEANKELVSKMIQDVFIGGDSSKITDYISTEKYLQHNPAVGDGLSGLGEALGKMAEAGLPMTYSKCHLLLGEGNFVLTVSEGVFLGNETAFYDLFRIENGKVVEHWDTLETIPAKSEWKNDNGKF